jgi:hypothetical protein
MCCRIILGGSSPEFYWNFTGILEYGECEYFEKY